MRIFKGRSAKVHDGESDEGFTLIELLVVVMIIGILLGIAIPTYLSITGGAKRSAAESNLESALTGAKTFYTQNGQSYAVSGNNPSSQLQAATGTGLTFASAASTGPTNISVATDTAGDYVAMAAADSNSTSATCYFVIDDEGSTLSGVSGISGPGVYWATSTGGTCSAATAVAGGNSLTFSSALPGSTNA